MRKMRILACVCALALTMGVCLSARADAKGNTVNTAKWGSDTEMMAAARAAQFWAIDAYGNTLPD